MTCFLSSTKPGLWAGAQGHSQAHVLTGVHEACGSTCLLKKGFVYLETLS